MNDNGGLLGINTCSKPMFVMESGTRRLLAANDAALRKYGYSEFEIVSMTLADLGPVEDRRACERKLAVMRGPLDLQGTWRHRAKDGMVFPVCLVAANHTLEGQSVTAILASDISHQVQESLRQQRLIGLLDDQMRTLEQQLEIARAELELIRVGLVRGVYAQLRDIHREHIRVHRELDSQLPPKAARYLVRAGESVERTRHLLDRLLSIAGLPRRRLLRRPASLSAIADSALVRLARAAPARRVSWTVQPNVYVLADLSLVRCVLGVLLECAWNHTVNTRDAGINFGATRMPDGSTVYFVRDNGTGPAGEDIQRMFDLFDRGLPRSVEGRALDLCLARRIIDRHEGSIWADGYRGFGTTFYFTLGPEAVSVVASDRPPHTLAGKRKHNPEGSAPGPRERTGHRSPKVSESR